MKFEGHWESKNLEEKMKLRKNKEYNYILEKRWIKQKRRIQSDCNPWALQQKSFVKIITNKKNYNSDFHLMRNLLYYYEENFPY